MREVATVKAKTITGEVQLQALVDEKKVIISKASIKSDLQFVDEGGVDCLPNDTIFEQLTLIGNMRKVGKDFSGRETPLFPTMLVQAQEEIDDAINEEMDDSLERAATTATSLDAEQDSGNINKTQSKATLNEPSSIGTSSGSGPRCQETIGDIIAQTRFENISKTSNDPLLARGNTLRSGEDSQKLNKLMELCTNLQQRVLDLKTTKTSQAQEITSLKKRVKRLEKKGGSRTYGLKRLYKVKIQEKGKGKMVESEPMKKLSKKDQLMLDEELAFKLQAEEEGEEERLAREKLDQRLQAEEQEELTDEQKARLFVQFLEKRRKLFAAKRAEEKRNRPPTRAQQRIIIADGNSHMYLTFSKKLKNFDREDLEVLWRLVKARFEKIKQVDYMDNLLLHNLKTMFEHYVKDNIWKNQQVHIYDSYRVHRVTLQSIPFYLLVEKMYPLTNHTLHQMFNDVKLQVDYKSEMAFELFRL
nr:hypothetical protein [Tanacetum cinerariifolium]